MAWTLCRDPRYSLGSLPPLQRTSGLFGTLLLWTKNRKNLVTDFCQEQSPAPGEKSKKGSSVPAAPCLLGCISGDF